MTRNKNYDNFRIQEFDSGRAKAEIDEAERSLGKLEGAVDILEGDICEIFKDEDDLEYKVHNTLERHIGYWIETKASEFVISVIRNGYVPQLIMNPPRYKEPNNK